MFDLSATEHRRFRPRTVYEYGFDARGPIAQDGAPSGYLLPWEAIDAHSRSFVTGLPCQYIVIGEYVTEAGMRYPDLVINPAWMQAKGYVANGRRWERAA